MRDFCAGASLLPTRADLVENGIEFAVRPELSPVFLGQAAHGAGAATPARSPRPSCRKIITVLKDQLEQAFVGGQSTDDDDRRARPRASPPPPALVRAAR